MSLWSRIANVFRGDRLSREIDEELESHIAEAVEHGRDPEEARRAFGAALRQREASRDVKLLVWLDALRADAVFGWRQLKKNKVTSTAAVLSLGLAIGACTSAFRLIDALLWRPLPVAHPERLYDLSRVGTGTDGKLRPGDTYEYPVIPRMREVVKGQADLIAVSNARPYDLTYGSYQETEKANLQFVSGCMFTLFGLRPAQGRLLTEDDDLKPRAHPYAVLSYDYWTRRFGQDPQTIGHTFRTDNTLFTIVGVAPQGFTGTQPGTVTDIFVPVMMHPGVSNPGWGWHKTLVVLKPGAAAEPVHQKLQATFRAFQEERAKGFVFGSQRDRDQFTNQELLLEPAPAGVSPMQRDYRRALAVLAALVALVLLIACANVANLMTARAAARAREMALRVSIGAGRWRLIQLVLLESAWLAVLATVVAGVFAWWSAPFVVSKINPPEYPARLILPLDARVLGFGLALAFAVTLLFGLAPALHAAHVQPVGALKGGENPQSRRRLMRVLIAVQVAFCFLVHLAAGLFVATFERLSHQPTGFAAERLLVLDTLAARPQPPVVWEQLTDRLRAAPGVERAALSGWALLSGNVWSGLIAVNGGPPSPDRAYFLSISPGWLETMRIPLLAGRDFTANDTFPDVAIVSESFAGKYFAGENPIGRWFENVEGSGKRTRLQIVGIARDVRYRSMRDPMAMGVYVPWKSTDARGALQPQGWGRIIVRTASADPLALASYLRKEVPLARSDFRVSVIRPQIAIVEDNTVRERLLAMLGSFFAGVALLLAGVGLYGVLHYSVLQRRREIGIRIALGARALHIARQVTVDVFLMVVAGGLAGLALSMASVRYIATLLYDVKATDMSILALPSLTIIAAALVTALPAVIRAVRIDPAAMLRTE